MSDDSHFCRPDPPREALPPQEGYVVPAVVDEYHLQAGDLPPRPARRRLLLPALLFIATCMTTYFVGLVTFLTDGWQYCLAVMTILGFHEAGHFLQARRYGVPASLPFFIPIPAPPIGTLGAVIGMSSRITDRRALFDIGVTGPLAGLVPTLVCCVVGVWIADAPAPVGPNTIRYGDPILLKLLYQWRFGPMPEGYDIMRNPILWAGWVGLLITALNLMPIGQLDGGHVLYALIRGHAHRVATLLLLAAIVCVVVFGYYWWTLMLGLLVIMGPKHPPTARDDVPLGFWRIILGLLVLAFVPLGFTPKPLISM